MKDFYELMSQVGEKNRQKRMMLAQAIQPFFAALNEKFLRLWKEAGGN